VPKDTTPSPKTPSPPLRDQKPRFGIVRAAPCSPSEEEENDRTIEAPTKEVWGYAGGNGWKWEIPWVHARPASGFQSLISACFVALWVLTYLGRPFE
jgi:hypothetical protein